VKRSILLIIFCIFLAGCSDRRQDSTVANITQPETVDNGTTADLKYISEQLDNTKGLSNSSVNCIFRDSQNLLWIGTWDGLNRYDGNIFKIFRPEPGNKNSLSNQVVLKIAEDKIGNIWVLTIHGINCYSKKTDSFTHYYFSTENTPPLSESQFNMALDASGEVFCAVKDWGLGYFDGKQFLKIKGQSLKDRLVTRMEFMPTGKLLVLFDDNKLYSLDIQTADSGKTVSASTLLHENVKTFDVLPNGNICMVSGNGNAFLSTPTGEEKTLPGKSITTIIGHTPEALVFASRNGYITIDFEGNTITQPWSRNLHNQKITTLVQGGENIVWTGTDGDGVFKIYPQKKSFNLISKAQLPELDGGIVRAFLKDGDNFWIGTKGKGLFRLTGDFYVNPDKPLAAQNFNEENSVLNNAVYALSKGKNGVVYIGTDGSGLTVYDLKSSKLISWQDIEGSKQCDYFRSTYAVYEDNEGFAWLGTNGFGIIKCKIERTGNGLKVTFFKRYLAGTAETALSSNIIFSIIPKNERELWIGTRLGGLNLLDKATDKFTTYKNEPNNPRSLSNNDILSLATDSGNTLWIGTSFGLSKLEKLDAGGNAFFKNYTVKGGLPNNTIHGIVPAGANLWISTNMGISNFATEQEKFINYSRGEGLQNNEFADGAVYQDTTSGYVFMGGIKGFNYFLPQKIKESQKVPDLLIDKISGHNEATPYFQGLVIAPDSRSHPSLVLKHNQNFFDIHLGALTYTNNEKCQYAYQLKGFDQTWNNIGNRKIISFTNVPRGSYSLWLKWSNSDGVWSDAVNAMDIKVEPVWWQSNLAVAIYVLLGILFILFVRSYNLKRQSLKQNILIRQKEEELHENRLAFFTNVAHEFLTPLTLIAGPVQKLSESQDMDGRNRKFVSMIQRNASRLLFLTQQLLEFRKAEHDYLDNTVQKFDFVNLLEQIAELFDDWALDKGIAYTIDIPSSLPGWYDKDKMEKIVFNLMSNAFKYTPVNGRIHLKCSIQPGKSKKLEIIISNTGKGIPKEKLDSLFDRFFLADDNHAGDAETLRTGIGLAYIKRLVTVLRGEIEVLSIPNKETVFNLLIPCSKGAFGPKEIDNASTPVLISQHLKNLVEEAGEKQDAVPDKIASLEVTESGKNTILVVEDEKEIHSYLTDLLAEDYRILSAYNGTEALEMMERELPDIIISDVMMPIMDGVEFCKRVKTEIRTCHIPFIMLTAKNSVIHRIKGLESGANSYIPKPFYPDHLLVRVQKLLEEKALILKHFTQDTLVDNLSSMPIKNDEKAFIRSVIDLIRKNIENESLNNAYLEKELGISTSQLYRKTKEIFSLSPGDLIRTIRLKHAAELLRKNELTVSEVCYKSGFNNRSYFYREFNKMYSTTPKNYQIQYKSKTATYSNN